jgi:futalosine hydrolase
VLRGVAENSCFDVRAAGVGPAAAAACAAAALATGRYDLVISAGIGGGFPGMAETGGLVVASDIIAADLGVETAEGFQSVDELGFGESRIKAARDLAVRLAEAVQAAEPGFQVRLGSVITVSTATGTEATARELKRRVPEAAAEAMEGFGVAAAARSCGVPCMELRGISNAVGPRNREAWRIGDALKAVEIGFYYLPEVLK